MSIKGPQLIRIFPVKAENTFFFVTCLFFAVTLFELVFWYLYSQKELLISLRILSDIVFLGTIHAILSYSLLLNIPEMKQWIYQRAKGRPALFWLETGGVASLILLAFLFTVYFAGDKQFATGLLIVVIAFDFYGGRHLIQQFKGLSLQYNQQLRNTCSLTENELNLICRHEKLEKMAFDLLPYTTTLTNALIVRSFLLESEFRFHLIFVSIFISFVLCSFVLCLSLYLPRSKSSYKTLYLLRVMLLPFRSISIISNTVLRAFHGIEFILLLKNVLKNTSGGRSAQKAFIVYGLLMVAVAAICTAFKPELFGYRSYANSLREAPILVILLGLNAIFNFSHYYLDAQMFRFRDQNNREIIGPLIEPFERKSS